LHGLNFGEENEAGTCAPASEASMPKMSYTIVRDKEVLLDLNINQFSNGVGQLPTQ
jgi:hypothetical protein